MDCILMLKLKPLRNFHMLAEMNQSLFLPSQENKVPKHAESLWHSNYFLSVCSNSCVFVYTYGGKKAECICLCANSVINTGLVAQEQAGCIRILWLYIENSSTFFFSFSVFKPEQNCCNYPFISLHCCSTCVLFWLPSHSIITHIHSPVK